VLSITNPDIVPLLTNLVTLGTAVVGLATAIIVARNRRGRFRSLNTGELPSKIPDRFQSSSDKSPLRSSVRREGTPKERR
jgi:hypothetical protein